MVDDDSGNRDATDGDEGASVPDSSRDDTPDTWSDSDSWSGSSESESEHESKVESERESRERTEGWRVSDSGADDAEGRDEDTAERIPLDLSGSRDEDASAPGATDEADDSASDPSEPEPSSTPIEAGEPDLENVVFVVIGAVAMLLVLARLVSLPL